MLSQKRNTNYVLERLLKLIGVSVSTITLNSELENHPSYPSLLSVKDCLNKWGVSNQTLRIKKETFDTYNLECPFIAHFDENGGQFKLIESITKESVTISDEMIKKKNISKGEFLQRFSGVALFAEANDVNGEHQFLQNSVKSAINTFSFPLLTLLLGSFLIYWPLSGSINTLSSLLVIIKSIGFATCILLLIESINTNNPLIQNICGLAGKGDCNAVLKSEAAKITTWLNWSEVGYCYFTGSLISLLILPPSIPLICFLSLSVLPYVVYSIGYQYKKKTWCILCCLIQMLLVFELLAIVGFSDLTGMISEIEKTLSINLISQFLLCFIVPAIIWASVKPFFIQSSQLKHVKYQLNRFKYNTEIFNRVLTSETAIVMDDEVNPLIMGNLESKNLITIISNPFCPPCAKAHRSLNELIDSHGDLQLRIIFSSNSGNGWEDPAKKVSEHLIAISLMGDRSLLDEATENWYQQNNRIYDQWATLYPAALGNESRSILVKHLEFCESIKVSYTPMIFINGYRLPENYRADDLKYLIS